MTEEPQEGAAVIDEPCPFCERIATGAFDIVTGSALAGEPVFRFPPLDPITPGHMLFVPWGHHKDASRKTDVAGAVMAVAAQYIADQGIQANIITSIGPDATQSVFHMHIHVVPRRENDGLALPWYSGKSKKKRKLEETV
jgi:histidine triad (HIT) family protein